MRVRSTTFSIALTVLSMGLSSVACAETTFSLSGFGTFGYALSDSSEFEYRTGAATDGADDSGTFKVDSRLGLQVDAGISDSISATAQALARQGFDGEFTPKVEWAFVRYQLNDSIALRFGRMGVPFFMVSDFREVGYANAILRPPEDTYLLAPLGSFDGVDFNSYFEFGETLVNTQLFWGARKQDFFSESTISLRDGVGATLALERGIARLRFSFVRARISARSEDFDALGEGLAAGASIFPELAEVAEDFNGRRKISTFAGIGLELDMDPWFVAAEFTQRNIENAFVSSYDAGYVTAGFRWNDLTPYLTVSSLKQKSKTEVTLPAVPQLDEARAALAANYAAGDQDTVALGLRWDFFDNAAMKVQLENISRPGRGASFTRDELEIVENPDDVKLYSLTLDFTF